MSAPESVKLTVFIRSGCHLCDDMLFALQQITDAWLAQLSIRCDIETIDIDEDAELKQRYGERVPVLMIADRFVCEYFLDAQTLRNALDEALNGI